MTTETVNRLPMPTYRYLKVNDTKLSFVPPAHCAKARFSEETFVTKGAENPPETFTGASPALLSAALSGECFTIRIPKDTETALTITLPLAKDAPDYAGFFSFILEENAKLHLLWQWEGDSAGTGVTAAAYALSEHATLTESAVQLGLSEATVICQRHVTLAKRAEADFTTAALGGRATILHSRGFLRGRQSRLDEAAFYAADGEQTLDFLYHIDHLGEESESNIDVRGALSGRSKKTFRGTIDFKRGCAGAVGNEGDVAVSLSPDAKNISLPLLLCTEDNVIGNHASSAGQLDDSTVYYLMSRGLTKEEAHRIVIESLLRPLIDRMPEEARKTVLAAVAEKLKVSS